MEPIESLATQALTQPEDTWFGNELLWHSYGMSGFNVHRDSPILEQANFRSARELITEKFGDENTELADNGWFLVHSTHWAVGWVDQIMVRVLIDPNLPVTEDNITDIFKFCMDLHELENPVIDDDTYNEMIDDAILSNIEQHLPSWAENLTVKLTAEIYRMLSDHDIYPESDGSGESIYFSEEQIFVALFMLGAYDRDPFYVEEMLEDLRIILDNANTPRSDIRHARNLLVEFIECADNQPSLF